MAINVGRQPRGLVKVNGAVVSGWIFFETDENEHSSPSTFHAVFAASVLPKDHGPDWWASQGDLTIELFAGFPSDPAAYGEGELASIFSGKVDDLTLDEEMVLEVRGRDLSAPLLDTKTSDKYINQTASQIATKLAAKYGLTPQVTATSTRVGTYYKQDHVDLKDDRSEWDLLLWLARQEGFQVFVAGKTLHFGPMPTSGSPYVFARTVIPGQPPAWNAKSVKFSRTLTVAKDIEVTVTSWNATKKLTYTRKATRSRKGSAPHVQKYSYRIGNLTPEQAQKRANQILIDLSRHEMKVSVEGPADVGLVIGGVIKITGTETLFDQTYFPSSIHRLMQADGGYTWSVEAKNHSPESEPNI